MGDISLSLVTPGNFQNVIPLNMIVRVMRITKPTLVVAVVVGMTTKPFGLKVGRMTAIRATERGLDETVLMVDIGGIRTILILRVVRLEKLLNRGVSIGKECIDPSQIRRLERKTKDTVMIKQIR